MTDGINNMIVEFSENIMSPNSKISEAIELLNNEPLKIIFVLDKTKSLVGTVTDGDIRRGTISGLNQSDSVSQIMNKNFTYFTDEVNSIFIENEMNSRDLLAIPILDKDKRVLRVHALKDLSYPEFVENTAIIMAGGFGKRLGVLTRDTPKPLLKIGKKPILLIIIENLKRYGFKNFIISLHYLPDKIKDFLGSGDDYGINIKYVIEKEPLGTAGCLSLIQDSLSGNNLVVNADVLTDIDYRGLLDFHTKKNSAITVCTREYIHEIPFGVVNVSNGIIKSIEEKPSIKSWVNAGIYVINFDQLPILKKDKYLDMPDLLESTLAEGEKVSNYEISNYWIDIGQIHDYEKAQLDINNNL